MRMADDICALQCVLSVMFFAVVHIVYFVMRMSERRDERSREVNDEIDRILEELCRQEDGDT